jgi:hypothetical protein
MERVTRPTAPNKRMRNGRVHPRRRLTFRTYTERKATAMRKLWNLGIGETATVVLILVLAVLFFVNMAHAQQPQQPVCMAFKDWKTALEGARPAQKMIGLGAVGNTHVVMFWASQGGQTWTILMADTTGKTCVTAAGLSWDQGRIPSFGERDA